jgi:hypothetical protein
VALFHVVPFNLRVGSTQQQRESSLLFLPQEAPESTPRFLMNAVNFNVFERVVIPLALSVIVNVYSPGSGTKTMVA